MGIQILPEGQGGFAASFGQGLGQGVASQLPEEIKRYRLKSGLENLSKQNIQDPYQLFSQLATVPGIDPGLLGVLAPALQAQIGRNQAEGNPQSGFGQSIQNPSSLGVEPRTSSLGNNAPQVEPLNQLAVNLLRSQPFNYPNIQAATTEAERRIANVESEINKQFESFLQKGQDLQSGEIGGDVRDLMRQKAIQELATTGKSERSIAQKYARIGKEIAKEYGSLRAINSDLGILNRPSEGTIKSIREIEGRLKNLGVPQDQILDRSVAALNISKSAASYILNPLKETKAGKYLHKLKENRAFEGVKNTFSSPEVRLAKEIAPLITSNDLMGSIAYIAKQKGYDARKLMQELQKIIPGDKLTTDQSRDLGNQGLVPKIPSLSQGWLLGWSGENKKARSVE